MCAGGISCCHDMCSAGFATRSFIVLFAATATQPCKVLAVGVPLGHAIDQSKVPKTDCLGVHFSAGGRLLMSCGHPPAWLLLFLARTVSAAFSSSTPWLHHCKHTATTRSAPRQLAPGETGHTTCVGQHCHTCVAPCCTFSNKLTHVHAAMTHVSDLPTWQCLSCWCTHADVLPCNALLPVGRPGCMQAHLLQAAMLWHCCCHVLRQLLVDVAQTWRHPDACTAQHATSQHSTHTQYTTACLKPSQHAQEASHPSTLGVLV